MNSAAATGVRTDTEGFVRALTTQLGASEWTEMTQEQVNEFARLTGDHNFLHVDPERAKATPFGGTIAHGFLSLSLLAPVTQRLEVTDAATSVNYGLDKVRFPAPLPVGSGKAEIVEVTEIKGGLQAKMVCDRGQGLRAPVLVAESLIRSYA